MLTLLAEKPGGASIGGAVLLEILRHMTVASPSLRSVHGAVEEIRRTKIS